MGMPSAEKLSALKEQPLWVHAVSVGEVQAASALIKELRAGGLNVPIVLSTTTETGKAMAQRLSEKLYDLHVYYPWDSRKYIRSALDKVNPAAFIMVETEIWPNMLWELQARKIPVFLANGRISDRTWKRLNKYSVGRLLFRELFNIFDTVFLRERLDGIRLEAIGVDKTKISVVGDLKIDALLNRIYPNARDKWKELLHAEKGPLYIAGSTHTGEDEIAVSAFEKLKNIQPDARLILAPRHPERTETLLNMFKDRFAVCKLSEMTDDFEIIIIDKIGVLFELYGIAEAAFIGGSFTNNGGQNILEPVAWGTPVQYGPHMEDFAEASAEFLSRGISRRLNSGEELADNWIKLAKGEIDAAAVRRQCRLYFEEKAGAAGKIRSVIEKSLHIAKNHEIS